MHTFASVTDSRFLNKVVLEQIEIANAIISQQNGHIYVVCFQTGLVQVDLSGPPSESFQNFQWSPPFWAHSYDWSPLYSPKNQVIPPKILQNPHINKQANQQWFLQHQETFHKTIPT